MLFNLRTCKYCKQSISQHKKCKQCEILLHEKNSNYVCPLCRIQHTLESKQKGYCVDCYQRGISIRKK